MDDDSVYSDEVENNGADCNTTQVGSKQNQQQPKTKMDFIDKDMELEMGWAIDSIRRTRSQTGSALLNHHNRKQSTAANHCRKNGS